MNKADLINLVDSYAHRGGDLDTEIATEFLPLAESDIGRDLKSEENALSVPFTPTASTFTIASVASDYGSIIALEATATDGRKRTLKSRDVHSINQVRQSPGTPSVYRIVAGSVEVRPFVSGPMELIYYRKPMLSEGDAAATDAVLDAWPILYLQATLVQLYVWTRDDQNLERALSQYKAQLLQINKQDKHGRAEKPARR